MSMMEYAVENLAISRKGTERYLGVDSQLIQYRICR